VTLRTLDVTSINPRFTSDIIHNAGFRRNFLKGAASRVLFVALLTAFVVRHLLLHDALRLPPDLLTNIPFAQEVLENMPADEVDLFHRFHVALYYCDRYVRAKRNKGLFLKTCGLLEGSGRLYITGGGNRQSLYTRCRVELFVFRTGVQPVHKQPQPQKLTSTSSENDLTAEENDTLNVLDGCEIEKDFSHSEDEEGDITATADPTLNQVGELTIDPNTLQTPHDPVAFYFTPFVLPPPILSSPSHSTTEPIFSIPSDNIEYFEMTKEFNR
jgi:hypothetical protein